MRRSLGVVFSVMALLLLTAPAARACPFCGGPPPAEGSEAAAATSPEAIAIWLVVGSGVALLGHRRNLSKRKAEK